jgi:transposase InsO family protein
LKTNPGAVSKTTLARSLGVSRQSLYYVSRQTHHDWQLKCQIEEVLRKHPAYGSRRIAQELHLNRKGVKRVMNNFGIKPYRRRGRKWRKSKNIRVIYPNLLLAVRPAYPGHVWAADFTELSWQGKKVFVATVLDIFTREIVGLAVSVRRGAQLTLQALYAALASHGKPEIFHSDNGKEYIAQVFAAVLSDMGIAISRTHPGCPWENGYQEAFFGQFEIDPGDPGRFSYLGELVAEVYRTVWDYNHNRIHSALKMPPTVFLKHLEQTKTAAVAA